MNLLDDIKAKIDQNGDGTLSKDDLESLKDKLPLDKFEELKSKFDQSGDDKLSLDDLKDFDFKGLGDQAKNVVDDVKGKLF